MKDEPNEGLYTYAMTKRMLLQGARALEKQYKMKMVCLSHQHYMDHIIIRMEDKRILFLI